MNDSKSGFIKSTPLTSDGSWVRHYTGYSPTVDEMKSIGWEYDPLGASAEGPSYKRIGYHLQIVQQGPDCPSVININRKISGYQNCHITDVNHKTIFFGYVYNLADIVAAMDLEFK